MKFEITLVASDKRAARVLMDGEDITDRVRGVKVAGRYDSIPTVELEIIADAVDVTVITDDWRADPPIGQAPEGETDVSEPRHLDAGAGEPSSSGSASV